MSRDALIAIGVCLIIAGVVMRGMVRSNQREQARRKQHRLHTGETEPELDAFDRHLEKYLPRYAAVFITAGALAMVASFWGR